MNRETLHNLAVQRLNEANEAIEYFYNEAREDGLDPKAVLDDHGHSVLMRHLQTQALLMDVVLRTAPSTVIINTP